MTAFGLASEISNGDLSEKEVIQRLNEIGSVTFEEVMAILKRIDAYSEWTSEELVYFFWKGSLWRLEGQGTSKCQAGVIRASPR